MLIEKEKQLRKNGTYNFTADKVKSELFRKSAFFDCFDLLQVKYEMLRAVQKEGCSITKSCSDFGLSRTAFYRAKKEFESNGLTGLIADKRGPKGPHKLKGEILAFLETLIDKYPDKNAQEFHAVLQDKFNITMHLRTVKRALENLEQKKGLQK